MTLLIQLNSQSWVNCIYLQGLSENITFWSAEKLRCHHVTHHVTFSVHAKHLPMMNLIVFLALGWPFYNFKSSKHNKSASLFGRRNKKIFSYLWAFVRATYSAIAMAKTHAWRSFCQNLVLASKDELAKAAPRAPTNDNGTPSHILAISRISTPVPAPLLAPAKLVAKYTNAELQSATKLALKSFI